MITAELLKIDIWLFPMFAIAAVAGILLVRHVPQKIFNTVVTVLAVCAACWMVVSYFLVHA